MAEILKADICVIGGGAAGLSVAAAAATDRPPEPAPITQISGVSVSAMPLKLLSTL